MTDQPIANAELATLSTLSPRLQEVEGQLHQLIEVLPRLVKDVKTYARIAQHMEHCAAEVNEWHGEIKSLSSQLLSQEEAPSRDLTDIQSQLMQLHGALNTVNNVQGALTEQILQIRAEIQQQSALTAMPSDRDANSSAWREDMGTLQQEWQTAAGMLQQMQVQIESLQSQSSSSQNLPDQIERIRTEMNLLATQARTEQESQIREQRKRLAEVGAQAGRAPLALGLACLAIVLGIIGIVR